MVPATMFYHSRILTSSSLKAWFYGEGLDLPVDIQYDTTLAHDAYQLAERWNASRETSDPSTLFNPKDIHSFTTNQKSAFLRPPSPSLLRRKYIIHWDCVIRPRG